MNEAENFELFIEKHQKMSFQLLVELAQIPAPMGGERRRAVFCKEWLEAQGASQVYIDAQDNVILPIGIENEHMPVHLYMAHSDVVFSEKDCLDLNIKNQRIYCPGIGDNSAHVAALMMAAKYLIENQIKPKHGGLLIVIDSGEEGLGNLKGCRAVFQKYGKQIIDMIAFDISYENIAVWSIGSRRYRVEVSVEGGHSYLDFGRPNAIAVMSELITQLYQMEIPKEGKTTFNAGLIKGGTSVNTIPQQTEMLFEIRSDASEALDIMERQFREALDRYADQDIEIKAELLGERPCSQGIDLYRQQQLADMAAEITERYWGKKPERIGMSTDCNIPLSLGIPAVCVGCALGSGAHTYEEYVEIIPGQKIALALILSRI